MVAEITRPLLYIYIYTGCTRLFSLCQTMTSPETAPFDDGLSQDHSSQDYLPPPNNQLQSGALHDGAPVMDYPVKANLTTYQDKSLEEVLSNFVPFNTTVNLTEPWEAEAERDDVFIQGVSSFFWRIYSVESTITLTQHNSPSSPSFSSRCGPGIWLE